MTAAHPEDDLARQCGWASIANSLLLPTAAALQLNVTFWVLTTTNFVLMHGVWIIPTLRRRRLTTVYIGLVKWPLIAFAAFGNLSLLLWGNRLLAVLPG